jgi:hypothetical protein
MPTMPRSPLDPEHRIPPGTQVVLKRDRPCEAPASGTKRAGSVGRVESAPASPAGLYRVRFVDGLAVEARLEDLAVRRRIAPESTLPEIGPRDVEPHLIYAATLGSIAYGLAEAGSDRDERGIFVDAGEWREELLSIRRQPPPFEEVHRRALELAAVFESEFERTALPEAPDVAAVDAFLIEARRSKV